MKKIHEWMRKVPRVSLKGIPVLIYIILFINVLLYSMANNIVFSFLPMLVKYFGATEFNAGAHVGIIVSSQLLGRFLFSVLWGHLAYRMGGKRSLILSASMHIVTALAFGVSLNLYWAAITKFLQGCMTGQLIIAKVILTNICDDSNMSLGLSVVLTSYQTGLVLGPSIGGFLVFPREQYPNVFSKENIFSRYVILLPNLIIALGLIVGILLTIKYIPRDKKDIDEWTPIINSRKHESYCDTDQETAENISSTDSEMITSTNESDSNMVVKKHQKKFLQALRIKECLLSIFLYCIFCFVETGIYEMFPIFAATSEEYKGMGLKTSEIGTVMTVVTIFVVVIQLTVLPILNKRFGSKRMFITSNLTLSFLSPLIPVLSAIVNRTTLWISLILLTLLIRIAICSAYLSINVLVNNSVGPELLGAANGIASMFASLGRLIAPISCGSIYSWSLRNINGVDGNKNPLGFPFNQFFVFFILSISAILAAVVTRVLPESMNFKKVREEET